MDVYIYQAALLCDDCGFKRMHTLDTPFDPLDEYTFDSDQYPKGPYSDGGGEADCPQHCNDCGVFLENPLTDDGALYVRQELDPYISGDDVGLGESYISRMVADRAQDDGSEVLAQWARFYPEIFIIDTTESDRGAFKHANRES